MRLQNATGTLYFGTMSIIVTGKIRVWLLLLATATSLLSMRPVGFVLTLVEVELVANDHVGDEWAHVARVDGWELQELDKIELASADAYEIQCTSREVDPHHPDSGSRTVRMTEDEMLTAATDGGFSIDVTVTEGHGTFAGRQAMWRFHFALR